MYKIKTTRRSVISATPSNRLFSAGYCELQFLLRNEQPVAYTSGVYGWNFDVYNVHGITICTGYRGMPGRDVVQACEFDTRAEKIVRARMDEGERRAAMDELLREFCELQIAQN